MPFYRCGASSHLRNLSVVGLPLSAVLDRRARVGLPVLCGHELSGDSTSVGSPCASAAFGLSHRCPRAGRYMFGGDKPPGNCAPENTSASFALRHLLAPFLHSPVATGDSEIKSQGCQKLSPLRCEAARPLLNVVSKFERLRQSVEIASATMCNQRTEPFWSDDLHRVSPLIKMPCHLKPTGCVKTNNEAAIVFQFGCLIGVK